MGNVAIVILSHINGKLKMLMVEQRTNDPECAKCTNKTCNVHIKYTMPAGKIENNETLKEAAIREFRQETKHELPSYETIHHYYECDTIISILYTTDIITEECVDTDEIYHSKWVSIDDISNLKTRSIFSKLYTKYYPIWDTYRDKKHIKN